MSAPHALILTAPGTNRDRDAADALELAGATTTRISLHALKDSAGALRSAQLVVLAGGFSHGDALGAGAVWASDVSTHLADELRAFVADGKAVIGICNGFQTLVRTGLLPGSLAHNAAGLVRLPMGHDRADREPVHLDRWPSPRRAMSGGAR